jgi:HK97 family phage portal protein
MSFPPSLGRQPEGEFGQFKETYIRDSDIYAAIDLLAQGASTVGWKIEKFQGEEWVPDPGHPAELLLNRCNSETGPLQAWNSYYSWLWLTGRSYMVALHSDDYYASPERYGSSSKYSKFPIELWSVPSDYVRPVLGDDVISYYRVDPPGRLDLAISVAKEDTIEQLRWHPDQRMRGLSPLHCLKWSLVMGEEGRAANAEIHRNGVMPAGVLMPAPGSSLSEEQVRLARDSIEEKHMGHGNRHRLLAMSTQVDFKRLQLSPEEAQFLEGAALTTHDVAKVFHIPPMFLGSKDHSTALNRGEGAKELWEHGILPTVRFVASSITCRLLWPWWGKNVRAVPDTSGIEALRPDSLSEATSFRTLRLAGMEAVTAWKTVAGETLPASSFGPCAGITQMDGGVQSDKEPSAVSPDDQKVPPPNSTPGDKSGLSLVTKSFVGDAVKTGLDAIATMKPSSEEAITNALHHRAAVLAENVKALWPVTKAMRMVRMKAILAHSGEKVAKAYGLDTDPDLEDLVNLASAQAGDDSETREAIEAALALALLMGATNISSQGVAVDPKRISDDEDGWIKHTASSDAGLIAATGRKRLAAILTASIDDELDEDEIDSIVDAAIVGDRPDGITATELIRGYGRGSRRALDLGMVNSRWCCSFVPLSRDTHMDADGQVRSPGSDFNIGGYPASYPGDPRLPASESVNCLCFLSPTDDEPSK